MEKYFDKYRKNTIGHDLKFETPNGLQQLIYADWIASGRLYKPIEEQICNSCWQSITPFEEKVGNNPDPCKVPVLNLKTREIKIMDFSENK